MKCFKDRLWIMTCIFLTLAASLSAFTEYRGGAGRQGYEAYNRNHVFTTNISGSGINTSQPVSDGQYVYVGTQEGKIVKVSLTDGTVQPEYVQTGGAVTATGLLREGKLYLRSTDGKMYAINTTDLTVFKRCRAFK
jgi:outer membrane protein assembly factor BamB